MGNALAELQKTCTEMRRYVSAARVEAAPTIDEANSLNSQRQQVEVKKALLRAFNQHFLLSDDEVLTLTSGADLTIDDAFFQTLNKAKTIHADSQLLLGTDNQRLGLEILEQTTKYLNAAFSKLYRWVNREFKSGMDLENPQMSFALRRALRVLAGRPAMFQSCLDAFADAREHALSDAFYSALTGASLNHRDTRQKPIEFSAHEPLRYIGDMLAWAHATAVSEREALESLFVSEGNEIARGIEAGLESEPWSRPEDGATFDGVRALNQLIERSLGGVAAQLRQRIEQVVGAHGTSKDDGEESSPTEEATSAYQVANLILFYRGVFAKMLRDEPEGFIDTLDMLRDTATSQFRNAMRARLSSVNSEDVAADVSPDDLGPPGFLEEAMNTLEALLQSYDASSASQGSSEQESGLTLLYNEALDPFLRACDYLAAECFESETQTLERHCLSINCHLAAMGTLSDFPRLTQGKNIELDGIIAGRADSLVEVQQAWFLKHSGLEPLIEALDSLEPKVKKVLGNNEEVDDKTSAQKETGQAIVSLPAFSPSALAEARATLDDFLPSALSDALERLTKEKKLRSSKIAHEVTERAAEAFCVDFGRIETAVAIASEGALEEDKGDEEEVGDLREIFPRTGEEVKILLT